MAGADQGEGCGYCCAGYASAGHPAGQRPDGNLSQRHCVAGTLLCGGKRAHQYSSASSGGHRGSESQRGTVWAATQTAARKLPSGTSTMEGWQAHRHSGGEGLQHAAVHLPLPGGDLRKVHQFVTYADLQKGVLFCKWYKRIISCIIA